MIYNRAFDPESISYEVAYDNALHCSPHFRAYAAKLAHTLCERYVPDSSTVVEIGSGDGFFLKLLCQDRGNRGWGFDPTVYARLDSNVSVQLVRGYFSADALPEPADLICCRHVLEHLPHPRLLLREVRRACSEQTVVFFEVPDGRFTLDRGGLWDILYEHCSYFTAESLRHLFEIEGFEVLRLESAYSDQFLQIEAIAVDPPADRNEHIQPELQQAGRLAEFASEFGETLQYWQRKLAEFREHGLPVSLWGAGTKGVMFLNALDRSDFISQVVDINPAKQATFIPGVGLEIVSPDALRKIPPGIVVLMNSAYESEVAKELTKLSPQTYLMSVQRLATTERGARLQSR